MPCSLGHYCPGGTGVIACPVGQYASGEGLVLCNDCSPGMFSGIEAATGCIACSVGHHCPGGTDEIPCPPGSFAAATTSSFCEICLGGMYSEEGATSCVKCPVHWNEEKFNGYGKCIKSGMEVLTECTQTLDE